MGEANQPSEGELILYQTPEGTVRIEVMYESDTFWLNQKKIAELFGVELPTISHHITEIYTSGELAPERTLRKIRRVQREGLSLERGQSQGRPGHAASRACSCQD